MSDKKITVTTTPKNRIVVNKSSGYSSIDTLIELRDVDSSNVSTNYVPVYDGSAQKFVIKETPFVNSSYQTANAAFGKANSANLLAYSVSISANAYSNTIGLSSNNYAGFMVNSANAWANTKVLSVLGTAGQIYSSGGTTPTINLISTGVTATSYGGANQIPVITVDIFGRLTAAANVTVQGMDYPYANTIGASSNAYARTIVDANLIVSRAYTNTSTAAANNYAGVMANSANAYAFATYGTITNTVAAFAAANQAGVVANNANAYAESTYVKKAGDTITGDLVVQGNVTISGNTTYVNTQTLLIGDSLITLNNDIPTNIAPSEDAGIEIKRGSSANVSLLWNEGSDKWTFTNDGTNYRLIASNTDVESANNYAGAIANTKLANTSGVSFAGDLYFPTGSISIGNVAPSGALHISKAVTRQILLNRPEIGTTLTDGAYIGVGGIVADGFGFINQETGPIKFGTSDVERMRITGAGDVGIGTSSPAYTLDVNGVIQAQSTGSASMIINPASGNYAQLLLQNAGTTRWRIRHNDTEDYLSFYDERKTGGAGSQLVIKDTTGNVGIGTTSPSSKLQVNGTITIANTGPVESFRSGANNITLNMYNEANGTLSWEGSAGQLFSITNDLTGSIFSVNDVSGIPSIDVNANGNISLAQFSGNVGIGTSNPVYKLDVNGDARITGNLTLGDATTDTITVNAANFNLANNVSFDSGTLFIDKNNDRIGVGTTSPEQKLDVRGIVQISNGPWDAAHNGLKIDPGNRQMTFDWGSYASTITWASGPITWDTGQWGSLNLLGSQKITSTAAASLVTALELVNTNGTSDTSATGILLRAGGNFAKGLIAFKNQTIWGVGDLIFGVNGAADNTTAGLSDEKMIIKGSTGNVGIGTTAPQTKLHVTYAGTDVNGTPGQYISGADRGSFIGFAATATGGKTWAVGSTSDTHTVGGSKFALTLLDTNSTKLVVDANGNVGINTSSPAYRLDVNGDARLGPPGGSGSLYFPSTINNFTPSISSTYNNNRLSIYVQDAARLLLTGDGAITIDGATVVTGKNSGVPLIVNQQYAAWTANLFEIRKENVQQLVVDVNGRVGVGTSSPSAKLHVVGDTIFTGNVTVSGNTTYMNTQTLLIGDNILTLNADLPNNLPATEDAGIEVNRGAYGNASIIWDETNDRWDVRANNNTYVTITESGRVGVGTTSPSEILTVSKSSSGLTVFPHLFLENLDGTDGGVRFYADGDGGGGIITFGSKVSTFATANGRPSHLTTDHPGRKAGIFNYQNGATNDTSAFLFGNSDAGTNQPIGWKVAVTANGRVGVGTTSPNSTLHVVGTANITSGIVTTGDITTTGTMTAQHFDNVSDITLKENIEPIQDALNTLEKLNPVSFTWKKDGSTSFGLIAQEVEKILPEIVHQSDEVKTVSYTQIISLLIAAIKELNSKLDDLT